MKQLRGSSKCKQASSATYPTMATCEDVCVPLPSKHFRHPLSGGGVFLLVLFFGFVTPYIVGGMAYNRVVHHASGIELLPHSHFWTRALPRAIGDGFRFATCRSVGGSGTGTYNAI